MPDSAIDYLLLIISLSSRCSPSTESTLSVAEWAQDGVCGYDSSLVVRISYFVGRIWIPVFTGMTGGAIGSGTQAGRPRDTRARCPRHVNKESPATGLCPEFLSTKHQILNNPK